MIKEEYAMPTEYDFISFLKSRQFHLDCSQVPDDYQTPDELPGFSYKTAEGRNVYIYIDTDHRGLSVFSGFTFGEYFSTVNLAQAEQQLFQCHGQGDEEDYPSTLDISGEYEY